MIATFSSVKHMNRKRLDFDGNKTILTTTGNIIRNFKKLQFIGCNIMLEKVKICCMHKLYMLIRMEKKLFYSSHWLLENVSGKKVHKGFEVRPTQTGIILTNWKKTNNIDIEFKFGTQKVDESICRPICYNL